MTDIELLDLIHNKSADELSLDEIELLRQGVASSPELRREIAERIEMEQYLAHALARVNVSVDDVIARASKQAGRPVSVAAKWGLAFAAILGGTLGLLLVLAIVTPLQPETRAVADASQHQSQDGAAKPEDETGKSNSTAGAEPTAAANPNAAVETVAAPTAPNDAANQLAQATLPNATAATPVSSDPWDLDLKATDGVAPSAAELFMGVPDSTPMPQPDDLKKWFANVDGQRGDFGVRDINGGRWGIVEGLVRLRAPLKPTTALRMAIWDYNNLRIHAWAGKTGITLDYFESPTKPWCAYLTTRKENEPIPVGYVLAARDNDRFWRTNPKPPAVLDLRHENGELILSTGDIRLLAVPMAVAPTEIYFEGNSIFRQITMVRAVELPADPAERAATAEIVPAKQTWAGTFEPGGKLTPLDDGGTEFTAEKNPQPIFATFKLPQSGLHEVVFQIDSAQPGIGLCLGDAEGKPRYVFSFCRNQGNNAWTQLESISPGENRFDSNGNPWDRPIPFVGPATWIKVVFGAGSLRYFTSVDGLHWARANDPLLNLSFGFETVGVYAIPHDTPRKLVLRKVAVRDFDVINSLASDKLLPTADPCVAAADIVTWRDTATKAKPGDADEAEWLRACAVRRLATGSTKDLGDELLQLLWRDSLRMKMSTETRLRLIDELQTLAPTWDDGSRAERYARLHEQLGKILADLGKPRSYSRVAHSQMISPVLCQGPYRFVPEGLARGEMLELAVEGKWEDLSILCNQFNFFHFAELTSQPDFYKWANALAAQRLPKTGGPGAGNALLADWRPPIVTDLSKEGFNVLADLRVALESKSYRDACQVIGAATGNGMLGLLPDTNDPELSVSLPATVALAMRDHPTFRETMSDEFGPLGRLRVRQAIASGDAGIVEAATLQFYGTEAAAEAHVWLGDRALSAGAFADAQGHYRRARDTAPKTLLPRLAAAEQLAAALMGHDAGQKLAGTIDFGDAKVAAGELVNLTNDLRTARAADSAVGQGVALNKDVRLPAPREYEPTARARLDGEVGDNPGGVPGEYQRPGADWQPFSIDWVARQAAAQLVGDRFLVSNRFQLASYDANTGQLQWRAGLGGDQAAAHDWPQTPMRPLATATNVFVRRLRKAGPMLASIKLADGQPQWETKLENERWVVSDPALVQGTLYACTIQRSELTCTLSLSAFDLQTGVMLRERPLVTVRESWWRERDCQMLANDELFVISMGGSVMCCDLLGNMRWMRRQTWIPPSVDPFWMFQAQAPPLLAGKRLFVLQPAVPAITAVEPDSGRLLWKRVMPSARRILGVVGKALVVEANDGLRAMDVTDGKRLWQFDSAEMLDGYVVSQADGVLVAVREPVEKENSRFPELVWLDPATGKPRFRAKFPQLKDERPMLGPLMVRNDRIWGFYGKGFQDANRDLLEFIPK